jgi:hypothetical protein
MIKQKRHENALTEIERARQTLNPSYATEQKAPDVGLDLLHAKVYHRL